jgi:hypothetical protein
MQAQARKMEPPRPMACDNHREATRRLSVCIVVGEGLLGVIVTDPVPKYHYLLPLFGSDSDEQRGPKSRVSHVHDLHRDFDIPRKNGTRNSLGSPKLMHRVTLLQLGCYPGADWEDPDLQ